MTRKPIIIWASVAHQPHLHDVELQSYLANQDFQVIDLSPNSPNNQSKTKLLLKLITGAKREGIRKIFDIIIFMKNSKNIQLKKKFFYSLQSLYIASNFSKNDGSIQIIFRGNNIPSISLLKQLTPHIERIIIPHGLYFQPPPENRFYLDANKIVTGTSDWPEPEFEGEVLKYGMIENRILRKTELINDQRIAICTTHSEHHQAQYLDRLLNLPTLQDRIAHIRIHPRNPELKTLINKKNLINNELNAVPISEYLTRFSSFIFTVGHNNRVSNVYFEAALCGKKIILIHEEAEKIVNLPVPLRQFVIPINNLSNEHFGTHFQLRQNEAISHCVFQSPNIFNDISIMLKR